VKTLLVILPGSWKGPMQERASEASLVSRSVRPRALCGDLPYQIASRWVKEMETEGGKYCYARK